MRIDRKGLLVVIEGIDGAGKTTVAKKLVERLIGLGYRAEYTYEPYSSFFSEALRKYIEVYGEAEPEVEVLAMALDRFFHVKRAIEPLLERGFIVVSDRYVYSSVAYQGAKGVDIEWIRIVNRFAPKPDVAIYLRVPVELGLERIKNRESKWRYFENIDRLKRVQEIYDMLVAEGVLTSVDATQSIENVVDECLKLVLKELKR